MSEKIIKCAKCQNNAETKPRRHEFNVNYPIRDKDGQIYCWDCYKNKSHCQGCGKSVTNIKFPHSGNPTYPHCNGGYSSQCERVSNKVEFICSQACAKKLADQKYQAWKDKLNQGWTKCEECWRFWSEEWKETKINEWIKEEKNQRGFIKLVQPGQGKLCSEHKEWEEKGKQEYERKSAEYQKRWEALSQEEKLAEVKKGYRYGENVTELATRSTIPPLVLSKWRDKDSHRRHNCPDCELDREPTGNDNNFSSSVSQNGSESSTLVSSSNDNKIEKLGEKLIEAKRQGIDKKKIERLQSELQGLINSQQRKEIKPEKNHSILILSTGIFLVFALVLGVILIGKKKNKR